MWIANLFHRQHLSFHQFETLGAGNGQSNHGNFADHAGLASPPHFDRPRTAHTAEKKGEERRHERALIEEGTGDQDIEDDISRRTETEPPAPEIQIDKYPEDNQADICCLVILWILVNLNF